MGKDGGKEGRIIEGLCRVRQALTFLHSQSDGMMHIVRKNGKSEKSMDNEMMQDHENRRRQLRGKRIRHEAVFEYRIGKGQLSRRSKACCSSLSTLTIFMSVLSYRLEPFVSTSTWITASSAGPISYIIWKKMGTIKALQGEMIKTTHQVCKAFNFWTHLPVNRVKAFRSKNVYAQLKETEWETTYKTHYSSSNRIESATNVPRKRGVKF